MMQKTKTMMQKAMKRQTLVMCLAFVLCSVAVCAQSEQVDSTKNASAVNVSEIFSKLFVLPEAYMMNTFNFEVNYTLYKGSAVRFTGCKFTSSITKRTSHDALRPNFDRNNLHALNSGLQSAIVDWFKSHGEVLLQTGKDFDGEDSVSLVTQVYYSPILYAQPGDTLFCTGEVENEYLCEGEEAATFYQYYVRNNSNTPYFALVKRNKNNVTLMIHASETGKLVNIVTYHIRSVELVTKEGNQLYMGEDGKSIRIKQVWKDNQLVSAEVYNSGNKVDAQYEFVYLTWFPKLKKKDVLYPNGNVKLRTEFDKDKISVTAFNEDGSKAKYSESKGAEKAINAYFKKHFSIPAIGYEYSGINEMILKAQVTCTVAENGAIKIISGHPSVNWSYNYKKGFISNTKINQMIENEYRPYFRELWETVKEQPFECAPAKMNGRPVASVVHINVEHSFTPKYSSKRSIVPPGVGDTNPPKMMPKWKPGKQQGKPVRVKYTVPVNFRL